MLYFTAKMCDNNQINLERPLRICDHVSISADTHISENRLRGYITHLKKVGLVEEKRIGYDFEIVPVNLATPNHHLNWSRKELIQNLADPITRKTQKGN